MALINSRSVMLLLGGEGRKSFEAYGMLHYFEPLSLAGICATVLLF
jgi:hypothetical protein